MKTKFVVGDVVLYNGKQCVIYNVELIGYDLHYYETSYSIAVSGNIKWVNEDELKSVY